MTAETAWGEPQGPSENFKGRIREAVQKDVREAIEAKLPRQNISTASDSRMEIWQNKFKEQGREFRPWVLGYVKLTSSMADLMGKVFDPLVSKETRVFPEEPLTRGLAALAKGNEPLEDFHFKLMNLPVYKQLLTRPVTPQAKT